MPEGWVGSVSEYKQLSDLFWSLSLLRTQIPCSAMEFWQKKKKTTKNKNKKIKNPSGALWLELDRQ